MELLKEVHPFQTEVTDLYLRRWREERVPKKSEMGA